MLTSCSTANKAVPEGAITSLQSSGKAAALSVKATKGKTYQLQKTTDLSNPQWNNVGDPIVADSKSVSIIDTNAIDQSAFYRIIPLN